MINEKRDLTRREKNVYLEAEQRKMKEMRDNEKLEREKV